jgi:hypothetical protein
MDANEGTKLQGSLARTGGYIPVPAGRGTQTCGLRVLQYHAIIGNAFAACPEILREGEVTMQKFIKDSVLPQIQQVNAETTETYYNEMRLHLQQTERMALLRTHPTWPDIQSLPRKRKSTMQSQTANNHNGEEQIYRKELRQMQLWEPRLHLLEQNNSSVERTRDMEIQVPTQESTMQLQQIQRWLDESTMEEIQELHQARRQTGSTLLRTLTTSKLRQRQQQRSDCYHRQGMDETPEELSAADTVTTVTAVTQWLTWIIEMEMHQTLR